MKALSLNILDIVQNSVKAEATLHEIIIDENIDDDKLTIVVSDNGCGMSPEFLSRVRDPFTTTRTTRRVGMGIPLFELAAQQAGGSLEITSDEGVGTCVTARFQYNHIDRAPVGDMAGTMVTLVSVNQEIKEILGDVPLDSTEVLSWIMDYITEGLGKIREDKQISK